jgi:hypothetical protein
MLKGQIVCGSERNISPATVSINQRHGACLFVQAGALYQYWRAGGAACKEHEPVRISGAAQEVRRAGRRASGRAGGAECKERERMIAGVSQAVQRAGSTRISYKRYDRRCRRHLVQEARTEMQKASG